ncbi:MAG: YkvA family protein [Clostridia bacterium]
MDKESDNAKILLEDTDKLEHFLEKLEQKLKKVPLAGTHLSYIPVFVSLIKSYIKKEYTEIPTGSIIAIVACLIYFVSPIDLIPDTIPGVGYADDAALIAFALSMVESDIEDYKEWKKSL